MDPAKLNMAFLDNFFSLYASDFNPLQQAYICFVYKNESILDYPQNIIRPGTN